MSRLHEFERRIEDLLHGLLRSPESPGQKRELIEVHRAILDEIAAHVDQLPRGRRVFSYPRVLVSVLLPDPARRRAYELVFSEANALTRDVRARLEDDNAEVPADLKVDVDFPEHLPEGVAARGFDIRYEFAPPAAAPPQPAPGVPCVRFAVTNGKALRDEFLVSRKRINLGRLEEVVDAQQRLLRRNEVAFADEATGANATVSRTHAHLEFDPASGQFRLFDDRSAYGTTVLRDGNIIQVPRGSSKGVALEPGDEILLGQARLRFDIEKGSA